jgi:hypothetical protein
LKTEERETFNKSGVKKLTANERVNKVENILFFNAEDFTIGEIE